MGIGRNAKRMSVLILSPEIRSEDVGYKFNRMK
jgi:hypothetical protein